MHVGNLNRQVEIYRFCSAVVWTRKHTPIMPFYAVRRTLSVLLMLYPVPSKMNL